MIDIHCHILPGIDDGPHVMQESLRMARMASDDGITRIVATPHIRNDLIKPEEIRRLISELNSRISEEGMDLRVLYGADTNALIDPALLDSYTINGSRYLLLEFPHGRIPVNAMSILFRFTSAGFRPIITHPERNVSVVSKPSIIADFIAGGALIQLTAGSITGEFGSDAARCSRDLLERGQVHFIASDAHSTEARPPLLSGALKRAGKFMGRDAARALVFDNPEAVLANRSLEAM